MAKKRKGGKRRRRASTGRPASNVDTSPTVTTESNSPTPSRSNQLKTDISNNHQEQATTNRLMIEVRRQLTELTKCQKALNEHLAQLQIAAIEIRAEQHGSPTTTKQVVYRKEQA